jgi:UMF1 family MFS transporter
MVSVKTRALISWAFYDWANSAVFAVIQTFVFASYFTRQVAVDESTATAQWAAAQGLAGAASAIAGPLLGASADQSGRRKPWILLFTAVSVAATALLWLVRPAPAYVPLALTLLAVGSASAQCAMVFYTAMLPGIAPPERIGRWSGWGWGLGYAGGLVCLALALLLFVGNRPLIELDRTAAEHVRATFILVAVWYAAFSLPLFLFTPDEHRTGKRWAEAARDGWHAVWNTVRRLRTNLATLRFIVAWMFCADGLATMFIFGGVFAAGTFDMAESDVIKFGIALNLVAGLGAAAFAPLDDWLGGKRLMLVSLAGLVATATLTVLAQSLRTFWAFGVLLGIFVGPLQAASRSYLARTTPQSIRSETFGFYALAGKATGFLGPLFVGGTTYATGSQRLGMAVVIVFFVIGLAIMTTVGDDKRTGG